MHLKGIHPHMGTLDKNAGELGEDFVEWACQSPLGRDFLFRGQKYRDGPNAIELCDLLLLLDDTAVLMEVKTADREKRPNRTEEAWSEWANSRLKNALPQIQRGVMAMRSGLASAVENERRGRVRIDPSKLKHYYGIAIVDHPTLDKVGRGPILDAGGIPVSVLTTTHSELMDLFTELSTPGDLIDYLQAREVFFAKNMMMAITELDLLAFYKRDPEGFRDLVADNDVIWISEGYWDEFAKQDARKHRQELDKPSLLVDLIIDKLHEGRHANLPHVERRRVRFGQQADPAEVYAAIAEQLSRLRRIERRDVGQGLIEKSHKCVAEKRDRWFASSPMSKDSATFVFMVSTSGREERLQSLEMVTMGAMLKCNAERVVGIATEPVTGGHGFSVDAFMISGNPEEYRKAMSPNLVTRLLKQFGAPRKSDVTEFGDR